MESNTIFVHDFLEHSCANGPGIRSVVWTQGCPRRCKGCCNPDSLVFDQRSPITVGEIARRVIELDVQGVTFTGGEPFSQAGALVELARQLRAVYGESFTIVCFTGYKLEQIRCANQVDWNALLHEIDLLIDGEYIHTERCNELLRGSKNQRLHFLTGRIRPQDITGQRVEYILTESGGVTTTGFPS